MIKKNKILLIGGYGFLGKNLFKKIKKEYTVVRFGNRSVKSQFINLNNLKNLKSTFDIVINCAGDSSVQNSYKIKRNNDYKIVLTILKYLTKYQPQAKLIQISTASIFGNSIKSQKLKPISPYSKRKLLCEKLLHMYSKKNKINYKILRFYSVYGNGLKKQLLWDTCQKIKKKDYEFYGTGNEIRSWMHIDDFSNILLKILKIKNLNKKIYNFCGTQIIENKKLLSIFFNIYGVKSKPNFNMIKNRGNPDFMYTKKCDLKIIKYKQKTKLMDGIRSYIKWKKK